LYLADVHFIDGQALTPTSFGEFDATTGVWNPKAYTGTYGTNGFHLDFADNSSNTATTLGKDTCWQRQ
jgi:alpha-acetolactate decarboxylase